METQRLLLHSTRGVPQELDMRVERIAGGYCVRSELRIDGCHPRTGRCLLTPLSLEAATTWANAYAAKLARSAAAFTPAKTLEDRIAELFFAGE